MFSIDVEEGKPALKLPYNLNEDPWFAAQKFLGGILYIKAGLKYVNRSFS